MPRLLYLPLATLAYLLVLWVFAQLQTGLLSLSLLLLAIGLGSFVYYEVRRCTLPLWFFWLVLASLEVLVTLV